MATYITEWESSDSFLKERKMFQNCLCSLITLYLPSPFPVSWIVWQWVGRAQGMRSMSIALPNSEVKTRQIQGTSAVTAKTTKTRQVTSCQSHGLSQWAFTTAHAVESTGRLQPEAAGQPHSQKAVQPCPATTWGHSVRNTSSSEGMLQTLTAWEPETVGQ